MKGSRVITLAALLLLLIVGALAGNQALGGSGEEGRSATPTSAVATTAPLGGARSTATTPPISPSPTAATRDQPATGRNDAGLPTIAYARLPREAQETIGLIDAGGPFPYSQDGTTFGNRERLLPLQPQGYYREYTVITPGSRDRGARRIVAGRGGELYYTDDHYDSFRRVVR